MNKPCAPNLSLFVLGRPRRPFLLVGIRYRREPAGAGVAREDALCENQDLWGAHAPTARLAPLPLSLANPGPMSGR